MPSDPFSQTPDIASVAQLVEPPQIPPHRSHDRSKNLKRSDPFQFGSRYLETGDDVFEFNAWDHVEPDDDYKNYAEIQYAKQRESPASDFDRERFNSDPAKWWDLFYKNNTDNFFKNRKWLRQEFPVLAEVTRKDAGRKVVLEVGAGAGNTAFPLLLNNENDQLMIHACDFSKKAVNVMRESEHYDPEHIMANVWDVASIKPSAEAEGEAEAETIKRDNNNNGNSYSLPPALTEESVDVAILIFTFSALSPDQWDQALRNIYHVLKPGGRIVFRDYGQGDLAQVRFKKGRYLAENFYIRGDGTRVYFFNREELAHIWGAWTLENGLQVQQKGDDETAKKIEDGSNNSDNNDSVDQTDTATITKNGRKHGPFTILNLGVDRRLIVNRQRKLKMYRCWLQMHIIKHEQ